MVTGANFFPSSLDRVRTDSVSWWTGPLTTFGTLRRPKQSDFERNPGFANSRNYLVLELFTAYDFFQAEQRSVNSQPTDHATESAYNGRPDTRKHGADYCPHPCAAHD